MRDDSSEAIKRWGVLQDDGDLRGNGEGGLAGNGGELREELEVAGIVENPGDEGTRMVLSGRTTNDLEPRVEAKDLERPWLERTVVDRVAVH